MLPHEIEQESFRIIRSELGPHKYDDRELTAVVRVIHATGDFDYGTNLRFGNDAVTAGIAALRRGCAIVTDVRMVEVGLSANLVKRFGGQVVCEISGPEVLELARAQALTRATVAMRRNAGLIAGGVVAIGNAPTALIEVLRQIREEGVRPALVVGVPVGFVNAVESKEALAEMDVPYVTALGRKGGSSVAVAVVNALLRLAAQAEDRSNGHSAA
ncbi:MAG TPA: precorrin-8X methylmutase [Anaerolineae bacterium]